MDGDGNLSAQPGQQVEVSGLLLKSEFSLVKSMTTSTQISISVLIFWCQCFYRLWYYVSLVISMCSGDLDHDSWTLRRRTCWERVQPWGGETVLNYIMNHKDLDCERAVLYIVRLPHRPFINHNEYLCASTCNHCEYCCPALQALKISPVLPFWTSLKTSPSRMQWRASWPRWRQLAGPALETTVRPLLRSQRSNLALTYSSSSSLKITGV